MYAFAIVAVWYTLDFLQRVSRRREVGLGICCKVDFRAKGTILTGRVTQDYNAIGKTARTDALSVHREQGHCSAYLCSSGQQRTHHRACGCVLAALVQ